MIITIFLGIVAIGIIAFAFLWLWSLLLACKLGDEAHKRFLAQEKAKEKVMK